MQPLEMEQSQASVNVGLSVSNAVWVATALLHEREGKLSREQRFSTEEIVSKVISEHLTVARERSVYQHVNRHCVANRPPQPNRSCMLFARGRGDRRLFIPGDKVDEARKGAPTRPEPNELPPHLRYLISDYEKQVAEMRSALVQQHPLHPFEHLLGSWTFGDADTFVNELREGWD